MTKLQMTKSGKTKIDFIPQKKRYRPAKLKLIDININNKDRVDIVKFNRRMKAAEKNREI